MSLMVHKMMGFKWCATGLSPTCPKSTLLSHILWVEILWHLLHIFHEFLHRFWQKNISGSWKRLMEASRNLCEQLSCMINMYKLLYVFDHFSWSHLLVSLLTPKTCIQIAFEISCQSSLSVYLLGGVHTVCTSVCPLTTSRDLVSGVFVYSKDCNQIAFEISSQRSCLNDTGCFITSNWFETTLTQTW